MERLKELWADKKLPVLKGSWLDNMTLYNEQTETGITHYVRLRVSYGRWSTSYRLYCSLTQWIVWLSIPVDSRPRSVSGIAWLAKVDPKTVGKICDRVEALDSYSRIRFDQGYDDRGAFNNGIRFDITKPKGLEVSYRLSIPKGEAEDGYYLEHYHIKLGKHDLARELEFLNSLNEFDEELDFLSRGYELY